MNTRRWLGWVAGVAVVLALGGCGDKEKDKDKATDKASPSTATPSGVDGGPAAAVNARDEMGFTPLHDAAARREGIDDLIRRGADVNAKDKEMGWTALHWAADDGDVEMISQLLAAKADVDAANLRGRTPLHLACERGHVSAVQALLTAHANPKFADSLGRTPLHHAVFANNCPIVELLLTGGVDVNAAAKDGRTPLQTALTGGRKEMADLLRKHGASPVKLPDRQDPIPQPPAATRPS